MGRGKLYCALTCSVMSKNWAGVSKHIEGYRYRRAKGTPYSIWLATKEHEVIFWMSAGCLQACQIRKLVGVCHAELLDQGQTQLMEEPELASSEVSFLQHGFVPARSCIDTLTMAHEHGAGFGVGVQFFSSVALHVPMSSCGGSGTLMAIILPELMDGSHSLITYGFSFTLSFLALTATNSSEQQGH